MKSYRLEIHSLPNMSNGQHPEEARKDESCDKTGIVVVQGIASPRWDITILVRRDCLDARWDCYTDCLRSECDVVIRYPWNSYIIYCHELNY